MPVPIRNTNTIYRRKQKDHIAHINHKYDKFLTSEPFWIVQ